MCRSRCRSLAYRKGGLRPALFGCDGSPPSAPLMPKPPPEDTAWLGILLVFFMLSINYVDWHEYNIMRGM